MRAENHNMTVAIGLIRRHLCVALSAVTLLSAGSNALAGPIGDREEARRILSDVQRKLEAYPSGDEFAEFDLVDVWGSNLRETLAAHPSIVEVIPLGPKATYIRTIGVEPDALYMHPDLLRNIWRLCRVNWQIAVPEQASVLHPGELRPAMKEVPPHKLNGNPDLLFARFYNYVIGVGDFSATTENRPITGARCAGAFDLFPVVDVAGSSLMAVHVERELIVTHEKEQRHIAKPEHASPGDPRIQRALLRAMATTKIN